MSGAARLVAASIALAALSPRPALCDDEEASFHLELAPMVLRVGNSADSGATDAVAGGRLSLRGTYGLTDTWAADVTATGFTGGAGRFPATFDGGAPGVLIERQAGARLTAGLTARLGVRWIPTLTIFGGYQRRWYWDKVGDLGGNFVPAPASASATGSSDLVVGIGIGLDFRLGARWIFGVSFQLVYSVSFDGASMSSIEAPFHAAHYSYPVNW
jgi:hypothetical protein